MKDTPAPFEQAKKTDSQPQFLQIVAKPGRVGRKVEAKPDPKLTRVAFAVSRLMEFCSVRELQNQTGHSVYDWPLVVLKELSTTRSTPAKRPRSRPISRCRRTGQDHRSRTTRAGIDVATIKTILDYTSASQVVKPMSRRPAARKATRSRPFWPWATCSIASRCR